MTVGEERFGKHVRWVAVSRDVLHVHVLFPYIVVPEMGMYIDVLSTFCFGGIVGELNGAMVVSGGSWVCLVIFISYPSRDVVATCLLECQR